MDHISGVGVSATTGKGAHDSPEGGCVVAFAEGMGGDTAYLLYDDCPMEDGVKNFRGPPLIHSVASCRSEYVEPMRTLPALAIRPRPFDAVMQQLTRFRPRLGGEARCRRSIPGVEYPRGRVRLRREQWSMLKVRAQSLGRGEGGTQGKGQGMDDGGTVSADADRCCNRR